MKEDGSYSRQNFLHEAAKIPGLYVPSLYEVSYKEDGTIAGFQPVYEDIPTVIHRQVVENMSESVYPDKPLVPFIKVTQDSVVLEIQRGCIREMCIRYRVYTKHFVSQMHMYMENTSPTRYPHVSVADCWEISVVLS